MTKKKKIWIIGVICVILLAAVFGAFLLWNNRFVGNGNVLGVSWYHENGTEYTISTAEELYELAELSAYYDFKGQTILLGADIVVNEGDMDSWLGDIWAKYWEPIDGFAGTFDGQGHTISGIYSVGYGSLTDKNGTVQKKAGLFSNTKKSCVIRDLRIANSYFCGDENGGVGSITSNGGGTFDRIYSSALVVCNGRFGGGLVGFMDAKGSHTITNCWFDGELRLQGPWSIYNGGMIGYAQNVGGTITIEHSLVTAEISCEAENKDICLGGFVGITEEGSRVIIKDCLNAGTMNVAYKSIVGSVVGKHDVGAMVSMTDVYASVECYDATMGAIKGTVRGYPLELEESLLTGIEAAKWTELDFKNYWTLVEADTPKLLAFTDKRLSASDAEKAYDTSWYNEADSVYIISNAKELYGFYVLSAKTDFAGKMVKLDADIVLNVGEASTWGENTPENRWYPIKSFAGVFDGQGHTISGAYVKTSQTESGFFSATTQDAMVKNLRLENSYFESTTDNQAWIGSIVGSAKGSFQTLYSNAIVVSSGSICGGMMGGVNDSGAVRIIDCWFDGAVEQTQHFYCGGIMAYATGGGHIKIEHCLNSGAVTAIQEVAGICGLVSGDTSISIADSLNTGKITCEKKTIFASIITQRDERTSLTLNDCFGAEEDCQHIIWQTRGALEGNGITLKKAQLMGYKGYQWTTLDFEKYWSVVKESTPILKSFTVDVPSLAGVKRKFDLSWYDKEKTTYTLDSAEDLYGFYMLSNITDFAGKTVKLGKDIVVNTGSAASWSTKAPEDAWYPISTFAGTFDGQGHSISGIYLKTDAKGSGLFSQTTKDAVLKNLKLVNSYLENTNTGLGKFGSIVGIAQGSVSNIYSNAIVVSSASVCGGLIGSVCGDGKVDINNCWFDGEVIQSANYCAGGIIGVIEGGCTATVAHCLNTGKVTGLTTVSGICGMVSDEKTAVTIRDTLNTGTVTSTKKSVFAAIITQKIPNTIVNIEETYSTIESCRHTVWKTSGTMNGMCLQLPEAQIKGQGGYHWTTLDFANYWAVVSDATPVLKNFADGALNLEGISKKSDISWYDANKTVYVLDFVEDLYGFYILSYNTDFEGKTVQLGKDIILNTGSAADWNTNAPTNQWYPIKTFAGTFDGQGHTISGIYVKTGEKYAGLFSGTTADAIVKNLKLENSYIESTSDGQAWIGSIAGSAMGTFQTIYSNATVLSSGSISGGLFGGINNDGTVSISNCWFDGDVNQTQHFYVGGIVGLASGGGRTVIEHCLNTGSVTGFTEVGGICGTISGKKTAVVIRDTLNSGTVTSKKNSIYGAIITQREANTTVTLEETYSTTEGCRHTVWQTKGTMNGICIQLAEEQIKGYDGYQWTSLDFANYWAVVSDTTPVLKAFAEGALSLEGVSRKIDISWYDVNESTYILDSVKDLYGFYMLSNMTDFAGKTVQLGADIVMNTGSAADWKNKTPENQWYPIKNFAGTFDGKGHSISGVYIEGAGNQALFHNALECTIKDFRLLNTYIKSTKAGGGSVAVLFSGTMDRVYSNAILDVVAADSSFSCAGGLVGQIAGREDAESTISNSQFAGEINTNGQMVGGIVAAVNAGSAAKPATLTISNCLVTGTLNHTSTAVRLLGGFCGEVRYAGNKLNVEHSVFAGELNCGGSGTTRDVGTFVGRDYSGSDTSSLCDITSSYTAITTYRAIGSLWGSNIITADKPEISIGLTKLSGTAAQQNTELDFTTYWAMQATSTPILRSFEEYAEESDIDISWYNAESTEMTIDSLADLKGFNYISNAGETFDGKTVKLGANIVMNEAGEEEVWTPIPLFEGTFDGQGHTISGVKISGNGKQGFFNKALECTIKNFSLTNSTVYSSNIVCGSIAAQFTGTMENVYSEADVTLAVSSWRGYMGGLVGVIQPASAPSPTAPSKSTIRNCWYAGTITTNGCYVGGIVGSVDQLDYTELTISNCLVTGTLTSSRGADNAMGGFCGHVKQGGNKLTIEDSLFAGEISSTGTAPISIGAVLGEANTCSLTFTNVYSVAVNYEEGVATGVADATVDGVGLRKTGVTVNGKIKMFDNVASLQDETVKESTKLDFKTPVWVTRKGDFPILKVFEKLVTTGEKTE